MLFVDTYKTISSPTQSEYKDKGSRFIAFAFPVQNALEAKQHIAIIKKKHASASHCCYAFVLGFNSDIQLSNDDGEPSNTAGKPILRAIIAHQLTFTVVIVVRYFGGKLLGIPGLIEAYGGAATNTLKEAIVVDKIIVEQHQLECDFEYENEAFRLIKQFGLSVINHQYNDQIKIIFEVRKRDATTIMQAFAGKHYFNTTFIKEK